MWGFRAFTPIRLSSKELIYNTAQQYLHMSARGCPEAGPGALFLPTQPYNEVTVGPRAKDSTRKDRIGCDKITSLLKLPVVQAATAIEQQTQAAMQHVYHS